ncbi:cadmium factor [Cordyceps javanica]|uniref:Cadmium factor n=1 Tax=Cordyceps javanica TaxID=43265 RepID=A0A545UXE2_9HYPO|nr:cadmium factor [Cordyceps javanica]TQW06019.1 cadmium factor [Cordyceps javanica]
MPDHRLAKGYASQLEDRWRARRDQNEAKSPSRWKPFWIRRASNATVLALALSDISFRWFWFGGLFKLCGDMLQILSPLLIRFLIGTLSDDSPKALGAGFGYAVGLFLLLVCSVTANVHGFYRSYTTGILSRAALMHAIYARATTRLTERERLRRELGTGKLMSLMSADVTRVDFCCGFFHATWTSIAQMLLCFALAVWSLGYSALPGFALLALLYPLQSYMMRKLLQLRRGSMPYTDARIKAVVEAVSTIRLVKTNAYEESILTKIDKLRSDEVIYIRKRMLLRALNVAVSYTAPTLASVVSIIAYGATHQGRMEAKVVFPALAYFLLLRKPLQVLPTSLSAIADARASLERLSAFMVASDDTFRPDAVPSKIFEDRPNEKVSDDIVVVHIEDAEFAHHDDEELLMDDAAEKSTLDASSARTPRLRIDTLSVKKNQLVCITGPVASGKTFLIGALLGDKHRIRAQRCELNLGHDLAQSAIAFAPQTAWLLSETVRENIVFGRRFDFARYEDVLTRCCLHDDIKKLPDGDMTVVGELGVSLSGGQKQRISIARAIYGDSKLLLLDDCFSALDAHIGAMVFDMVVNRARKDNETTIVLVTHSVSFTRQADQILHIENGCIVERGTYAQLLSHNGLFTKFVQSSLTHRLAHDADAEHKETAEELASGSAGKQETEDDVKPDQVKVEEKLCAENKTRGKEVMQKEERLVGSVSGKTYLRYILLGNAALTVPLFVMSILIYQGTAVVSPLWLSWWQTTRYTTLSEGVYMGGFAAFGIGQSLGLFCMSAAFAFFCFFCSNKLHHVAMSRLLHAPMSFFDTSPHGRITHRFSKDVDAVDNVVGETLRLFISTTSQVIGTITVVAIVLPPFLAVAALLLLIYIWTGMYYRPSSRELRRLNNLLRSRIYEHFGESLSGLPTLKAFGMLPRFLEDNARRIDTENTAYWLSVACQRWLNLRLDLAGSVLVLGAGLLVVGLRDKIGASAGGLVLTYVVTAQQVFGNMIRQSAEIENNMNSVERLLHYAYNIEQEPAYHVADQDKALESRQWPNEGRVQLQSVTLSHRDGLRPAIRDVTLDIEPGEKIGVVGRTGAGKSTLLSALLRIREPSSGKVLIDGVDIGTLGLQFLRSRLSVISQDAVLLAGSIRSNLDPFEQHDDKWLNDCLKMVGLGEGVPQKIDGHDKEDDSNKSENGRRTLTLASHVTQGGSNISQGQRALISIARALVRRSKIVIFDEATASIDVEADAKLQAMLCRVLVDATVITIAHRLDTIISSVNRVIVMDSGTVAEFDTVSALLAQPDSLFRALCDAAKITV